jgi:hypothetical protein
MPSTLPRGAALCHVELLQVAADLTVLATKFSHLSFHPLVKLRFLAFDL